MHCHIRKMCHHTGFCNDLVCVLSRDESECGKYTLGPRERRRAAGASRPGTQIPYVSWSSSSSPRQPANRQISTTRQLTPDCHLQKRMVHRKSDRELVFLLNFFDPLRNSSMLPKKYFDSTSSRSPLQESAWRATLLMSGVNGPLNSPS